MNIEFSFQGIHFEWDNGKAQSNYKKYGVLFETACEAFLDPFVKTIDSEYRTDEFAGCNYWNDDPLAASVCGIYIP